MPRWMKARKTFKPSRLDRDLTSKWQRQSCINVSRPSPLDSSLPAYTWLLSTPNLAPTLETVAAVDRGS